MNRSRENPPLSTMTTGAGPKGQTWTSRHGSTQHVGVYVELELFSQQRGWYLGPGAGTEKHGYVPTAVAVLIREHSLVPLYPRASITRRPSKDSDTLHSSVHTRYM